MNDGERYQQFLRELWEPEIGHMALVEVTADDIRKVRNKLKDQGLAIATINRRVQPIKTAFSFASGGLESRGFDCVPKWIEVDVTASVKAWKENNWVERYLSEDELKRLREEIAKSESENLSDFFEFKLAAGCRWSEVMGLTWDNVDFENKIITFKKVLTRSKFKGQKEVNGKIVNDYDHHVFRDGLKNGESSRVLDMSLYPEVLDRLRKRKMKHQIHSNKVFTADFESLYNATFFSGFVSAATCLVSKAIVDVPSCSDTKFAFSFVPPASVPSAINDPTTLPVRTRSAVKS